MTAPAGEPMADTPTHTSSRNTPCTTQTDSARALGSGTSQEPVVVRQDAAPIRWGRRWVRAGRAEGRASEGHPVRAVVMLAAVAALAYWLPAAGIFVAMLSFLVFIHEGAHYLVARRCGMRPTDFFVGFGPTIWARTSRNGVRYGIKAIPAGGYVKIPGMGPREEVEASLEPYTYRAATRRRRLAVILAGVAANLVFAIGVFSVHSFFQATPTGSEGAAVTRGVEAVGDGVSMTGEVTVATVQGLAGLVTGASDYAGAISEGSVPENRMMSPIGGAQITDGILSSDPAKLMLLAGVFSASLALLNLLPLLPLDGGHAALVIVESAVAKVRGKPDLRLDPNRLAPVAVVVLVLLLALSATSAYIDILHPITLG